MQLLREAHNAPSGWRHGLVLKLMVGSKGVAFRLPLPLLLAGLMLGLGAWRWANPGPDLRERELLKRIGELQQENRRAHQFLARKDHEKRQALALAQERSEELWNQLQERDQQVEQIWKVVGKAPKGGRGSAHHKGATAHRRSIPAARNATPLQVKLRYLDLVHELENPQELGSLRSAARSYRAARERERRLALWSTRPSLWPCDGVFTSPFGFRMHPVLGYGRFHSGCDIAADTGTPIRSTAAGKITCADCMQGYGLAVTVDHGGGVTTLYGHCSAVHVHTGDYVRKGQLIASVGSTGMSTGPHCHYEVHVNGAQVDPQPYMQTRR